MRSWGYSVAHSVKYPLSNYTEIKKMQKGKEKRKEGRSHVPLGHVRHRKSLSAKASLSHSHTPASSLIES